MPKLRQLCAAYWKEALKLKRQQPQHFHLGKLLQTFPRWRRSLDGQATPLADESPWMTFGAIQFLQTILRPEMRVFEYGSGGSTLFFSRRVQQVYSVEHDPLWHRRVAQTIQDQQRSNCQLALREPTPDPLTRGMDPSDPEIPISSDEQFPGHSFQAYAACIDAHPSQSFDVVSVDGRARPACLRHSLDKVKTGGFVLVDNAERTHYQRSYQLLAGLRWQRQDFPGPGPYNLYFWQTTVWQRLA